MHSGFRVQNDQAALPLFFMFVTYILYSADFDRYYVGSTENIESRLTRHNNGMVISTKKYVPWKLVYTESFETRSEAFKRELQIKGKKSRKYIEYLTSGTGSTRPDSNRDSQ